MTDNGSLILAPSTVLFVVYLFGFVLGAFGFVLGAVVGRLTR